MATPADPAVLRALLVEDDEDDYLITRDLLAGQDRARFELEWCPDYATGLTEISRAAHDVYLIDYRLGERTGLDLVREGFAGRDRAPVILLTGQSDYAIDLEATALGVTDYLIKHQLDPLTLERSIRYAVSHHRAIRDLARSRERYALAVRAANDGIWDWDVSTGRVYLSPRWYAILGHAETGADAAPEDWFDRVHPDDVDRVRDAVELHLSGGTAHLEIEHRIRHADGSWRWVLARGLAIRGPDGQASRMAGSLSDITDRLEAEWKLQHDALHDALTGLPNRALFMDRVEQVLSRGARESSRVCAVLFLDIDRFKLVNDSLSHAVGDELLIAIAARISALLRPGDTVARLGGDEFTILLPDVGGTAEARAVAERVSTAVAEPFRPVGHELVVTASVGIAFGGGELGAAELVRNADIAMYDAKRRGRGRVVVFDEGMRRRVVDRLSLENRLRVALDQGRLGVHYQPLVDLRTGEIRGVEALCRAPEEWAAVSPLEFIPVAEETGMIGRLGLHVLRTALGDFADWRRRGRLPAGATISVNVSPRQLDDTRMPADFAAVIAASGVPPGAVRLEITEGTLMLEPERVRMIAAEVFSAGVGFHLDDFGTGYSSLAALHRLPVSALKIDRAFVAAMSTDPESDVIVRSTIALAHSLGLGVVAEGIEEADQLTRLQDLGCDLGQGFWLSRPLPRPQAEAFIAEWDPRRVERAAAALGGVHHAA